MENSNSDSQHSSEESSDQYEIMFQEVTKLGEDESDRGVILIYAEYINETLADLILRSCSSEKVGKRILEHRSPAGDFSSRILLCQALGILSSDEVSAINIIRNMRNSAAHFERKRGFDVLFDNSSTKNQVKQLAEAMEFKVIFKGRKGARSVFDTCFQSLSLRLYLRKMQIKRFVSPCAGRLQAVKDAVNFLKEQGDCAITQAMKEITDRYLNVFPKDRIAIAPEG